MAAAKRAAADQLEAEEQAQADKIKPPALPPRSSER
jgi:hypothetical protein